MKIAVLYICTGRYSQFWTPFYKSVQDYFLVDKIKHFFVFTDDPMILDSDDVTIIKTNCKGFPLDSLFRFDMFLHIEDELIKYDYVFFFNSNMEFCTQIGDEILPNLADHEGLVAVLHPGYYKRKPCFFPYERNPKSLAYIKKSNRAYYYYMGSLNGGITAEYLNLVRICAEKIKRDYESALVAVFHDESHLNKYLLDKRCLRLDPSYAYPEGKELKFKPKIIIKDKVKIDPFFNKKGYSLWKRLRRLFRRVLSCLWWPKYDLEK